MKKMICLALAILQILVCFAACGNETPSSTEPTGDSIVYTYPSEVPTYTDDTICISIFLCLTIGLRLLSMWPT